MLPFQSSLRRLPQRMLQARCGVSGWKPTSTHSYMRSSSLLSSSASLSSQHHHHQSSRMFAAAAASGGEFLYGGNMNYADEMYKLWLENPNSVHSSWNVFFTSGNYTAPPDYVADYTSSGARDTQADTSVSAQALADATRIVTMIRAFQVRGHLLARLDPLGLSRVKATRVGDVHAELQLSSYGFAEEDLDRVVDVGSLQLPTATGFFSGKPLTIRRIHEYLMETYCGDIGFEYMHIPDVDKCNWVRERIESKKQLAFTKREKLVVLRRILIADHFERFLAHKYATAKRFGLEGGESLIPSMKAAIDRSAELGVENVIMGMPHRGRLSVLVNVVHKPFEQVLCEFDPSDKVAYEDKGMEEGTGDVKYHLGASHNRKCGENGDKNVHLTLMANPSHLEAVNPLVIGKTRAKQLMTDDTEQRAKSMGILLHGDAAFAGQGIVYETMAMQHLPDYDTGGTIHIVVNNQIGFTTDPYKSRSTPYCTDVAKGGNVPIFHVNGDNPEAVVRVSEIAAEYRAQFHSDVVIDIVCFRKYGHNEIDEPSFTQPHMYGVIKSHVPVARSHGDKLVQEGVLTKTELEAMEKEIWDDLEQKFQAAKTYQGSQEHWIQDGTAWAEMKTKSNYAEVVPTGVDEAELKEIGTLVSTVPEGFNVHSRLKGILKKRLECVESGKGLDWALGEALAFGSLVKEGNHVRISGQDVERGTFSHRHAVLHDQKEPGVRYTPLAQLNNAHSQFHACNSPLSEYSVLGFELGYSMETPHSLVIWEAQFGDFFNGAQIIVDQFISAMEDKWQRQSGLVMLLPHGYEGMGPEHSSGRVERFLQGSNQQLDRMPTDEEYQFLAQAANWAVCNATTPANFFHLLRRQLRQQFRKPLIVMTPKSLLRHPLAKSDMSEFIGDTQFQPLLSDPSSTLVADNKIKRLIFCSGKVYYDIISHRAEVDSDNVAVVRMEQIAPFDMRKASAEIARYPNAEVVWAQEEPQNQGCWFFTRQALRTCMADAKTKAAVKQDFEPKYIGRVPTASTATGRPQVHAAEQKELAENCINLSYFK